jgi:4-carboxymuconolactone decarboxylase
VLGEEYVNNSINNADEFALKLQEFVTTHAWGAIWGREGLPLKTRSMINIAMLAALGRPHEFRLHLAGALNNGVTKDEIAEILIQVGGYAGFPCAVDGFRQAREVFKEKGI